MPLIRATLIVIGLVLFSSLGQALAYQCDCQQVVGRCTGAVELIRSFGSRPSYGAEIAVYSSEKTCSKVEYLIDSTPNQTVLVNKNRDTENIFGTSPITTRNIRYLSCSICRNVDTAALPSGTNRPGTADRTSPFTGTWIGRERNIFGFTNTTTVILSIHGNRVSGTWQTSASSTPPSQVTGTVNGNTINVSISPDGFDNVIMRLTSQNNLEYSFPFGSGSLSRE